MLTIKNIICSFCCKEQPSMVSYSEEDGVDLRRFFKLLERLSGFHETEKHRDRNLAVKTCVNCLLIMKSFCDMYHEWKCLEMKLDSELTKLRNVMKKNSQSKQMLGIKFCEKNQNSQLITEFRKDFKEKCDKHFSNSFPKVVLRRLNRKPIVKQELDAKYNNSLEDSGININHLMLGWISTFAAVTALLVGIWVDGDVEFCASDEFSHISFEETNPTTKSKRKNISMIAAIRTHTQKIDQTLPYSCFLCKLKFATSQRLQIHRRAFTHLLKVKRKECTRPNCKSSLNFQMPTANFVIPTQIKEEEVDFQEKREDGENFTNVGLLRPLRSRNAKHHSVSNTVDWDSSSTPSSSDDDSSTVSSSEDSKTSHPKNTIYKSRVKRVQGKYVCQQSSCKKQSFEFKEELESHKKFHGPFPCFVCKRVKKNPRTLALHELSHSTQQTINHFYKFTCVRCSYTTKNKCNYLTHHLNKHLRIKKLVMCTICKTLVKHSTFKYHMKVSHGSKIKDSASVQKCSECPAYFIKRWQLVSHLRVKHDIYVYARKYKYRCDSASNCQRKFRTGEEFRKHKILHGTFSCSNCSVVKTYAPDLALHEATHMKPFKSKVKVKAKCPGKLTFSCSRCSCTFVGQLRYLNHFLDVHLGLQLECFKCTICNELFRTNRFLLLHTKKLHNTEGIEDDKIARCDLCPAYFGKKWDLVLHKKRIHAENENIFSCEQCGKNFLSSYSVREHILRKHKKKESDFPIGCDFLGCGRRFEKMTALEYHKNIIHNKKVTGKEGEFVCEKCGKKCSSKSAIKNHMESHKEKEQFPVVCEQCGKIFKSNGNLKIHMLSHTGPESWPYFCMFCEKRCTMEATLLEHLRTHTNEKPFICEYCGEEYAHKHNLRNHKNKTHDANDVPRKKNNVNPQVSKKGQKLAQRVRK
ncbi:unnamed protein product [Orchesella dallaii]|uniref:C2H2-type domain-containing protein n=1 Tax=Orchesella dallaii TaxID=48710 RepID=A0ABP1QFA5_9HEXA